MIKSLKEYKIKLKEYNFHNKMYYDLNKPKISDEKFDTLKSELLILIKYGKIYSSVPISSKPRLKLTISFFW